MLINLKSDLLLERTNCKLQIISLKSNFELRVELLITFRILFPARDITQIVGKAYSMKTTYTLLHNASNFYY